MRSVRQPKRGSPCWRARNSDHLQKQQQSEVPSSRTDAISNNSLHTAPSLESLPHRIAKVLLPTLEISQQNICYYASLAGFYTIYDLRNLKSEQTYLYLLCYAWLRYRQLSDNHPYYNAT